MDNIVTYVKFRGDIPFSKQPFNEMDAMIMATIVAINLEGCLMGKTSLSSAYKAYMEVGKRDALDTLMEEKIRLFGLCAEAARYKNLILDNFVREINEKEEKTFYALTFYYGKHRAFVAYRGTDGTLLSWKENFNGMYVFPTPGQRDALAYLTKVISKPFMKVDVIGHSKGANLAVYAAMSLLGNQKKRVRAVYSFDGPGYIDDISNKLGYLEIKDRIRAYIPVSSVVGRLFEPPYEKTVVKASGKGINQHNLFNWEVSADGVVTEPSVDLFSDSLSAKLNGWLESVPKEDRQGVVDDLFSAFKDNGILHITDIMHIDAHRIISLVKCVSSLSAENRNLLILLIKEIAASH